MTPPLRYASAKALHDAIRVRVAAEAEHGRYDINQIPRPCQAVPSHTSPPR